MNYYDGNTVEAEQMQAFEKPKRKGAVKVIIVVLLILIPLIYVISDFLIDVNVKPSVSIKEAVSAAENDNSSFHITNTYNEIFEDAANEIENADVNNSLLYYNNLNDKQKIMYRNFLYAAKNFDYFIIDKSIYYDADSYDKLSKNGQEEITQTIMADSAVAEQAVYYDYPEIYWIEASSETVYEYADYFYFPLSYTFSKVDTDYYDDELVGFKENKQNFDSELSKITNELNAQTSGKTDWEKALAVYKWVCDNADYDYDVADIKGMTERESVLKGSIYSAVVDKSCVCRGYAELYKVLLNELGIECAIVGGEVDQNSIGTDSDNVEQVDLFHNNVNSTEENLNHVWNIIKIDGNYCNVDVTGGDMDDVNIPYDLSFFCVSDAALSKSHRKSTQFDLPECIDDSNSFFKHENLYRNSLNSDDFDAAISYAIENDYNFAAIQYEEAEQAVQAQRKYFENGNTIQKLLEKYDRKYDDRINIDDIDYYYSQLDEESAVLYIILNYR